MVFDEAHEIEDVASDYFGRQVSSYRFEELARDAENMLRVLADRSAAPLRRHLSADARARRAVSLRLFRNAKGGFRSGRRSGSAFLERNREAYDELASRGEAR